MFFNFNRITSKGILKVSTALSSQSWFVVNLASTTKPFHVRVLKNLYEIQLIVLK